MGSPRDATTVSVSPPPSSEGPPPSSAPTRRLRTIAALIVVGLVIVAIVLGVYYVVRPGPANVAPGPVNVAPHAVAALGNGTATFDYPYLVLYTAPALAVKGFATRANASYTSHANGSDANYTLTWSNVTGAALPVVFSFDEPAPWYGGLAWVRGSDGNLHFLPQGLCIPPCLSTSDEYATTNTGSTGVVALGVVMNYSVTKMSATVNSIQSTWLQVSYNLTNVWYDIGMPAPFANATAPTSGDLRAVGPPVVLNYSKNTSWSYDEGVHNLTLPSQGFAFALPPISIHTPGESFNATLTSNFAWSSNSDYHLRLSGTGGVSVTLQFYVDMRFGTLLVQYV